MARQASGGQKASRPAPVKDVRPAPVKSDRKAAKPASNKSSLKLDGLTAEQKVAALLKDRDRLLDMIETLDGRLKGLEAREAALADRIAWALDTLNDLLRERN